MALLLGILNPNGRTSRRDFWLWTIGLFVVAFGGHFVLVILGAVGAPVGVVAASLYVLWTIALGALAVRRVHDLGESSGLLIAAVMAIGLLTMLGALSPLPHEAPLWIAATLGAAGYVVLGTRKGDEGPNRYGSRLSAPLPNRTVGPTSTAQELRARMEAMALPTLLMRRSDAPVFSKLGGKPDLPAAMEWPNGRECARCFVAQLDLAEVRAGGGPDWLPAEGRLYFFYDEDGLDRLDLIACYATCDPPGPERSAPEGYEPDPMFDERRVSFERLTSLPSLDWLGVEGSGLPDRDFDELVEAPDKPFGDGPQHRIGGYASEIQSAKMELECEFAARGVQPNYWQVPPEIAKGAKDWRLLLQVDSDDELSMNWVDTGRLYVFIREQDARAGDFTKTAAIAQFY
jgi:uncharacterized protein YwqG/uncharacterized membrane protein YhaH (DUF805 family)